MGANKAHVGAGAVIAASYVQVIVVRYINLRWPGFLDEITTQAVEGLVEALVAWIAVYFTREST